MCQTLPAGAVTVYVSHFPPSATSPSTILLSGAPAIGRIFTMIAALGDGADDGGADGVAATVATGLVLVDAVAVVAAGAAGAEQPPTPMTAARIATSGSAVRRMRAW